MASISKRSLIFGLTAISFTNPAWSETADDRISRIDVYSIDWDRLSRTRLSVDDVRTKYDAHASICEPDKIAKFLDKMALGRLSPNANSSIEIDVRAVIDIAGGEYAGVYVCDNFRMYSLDRTMSRRLDAKFKRAIREL